MNWLNSLLQNQDKLVSSGAVNQSTIQQAQAAPAPVMSTPPPKAQPAPPAPLMSQMSEAQQQAPISASAPVAQQALSTPAPQAAPAQQVQAGSADKLVDSNMVAAAKDENLESKPTAQAQAVTAPTPVDTASSWSAGFNSGKEMGKSMMGPASSMMSGGGGGGGGGEGGGMMSSIMSMAPMLMAAMSDRKQKKDVKKASKSMDSFANSLSYLSKKKK
jgi:hypothetical protein